MRRAFFLVTLCFVASSCTLLVDASGLSGGSGLALDAGADVGDSPPPAPVDAGSADASPDVLDTGVVDAGPRKNSCGGLLFGVPEPLFNADYELGCGNGWNSYQAVVSEDTSRPSSGSIACRVCYTSGDFGFFLTTTLKKTVLPGEVYEAVACVRGEPADAGLAPYAELGFGSAGGGGRGPSKPAGDTYVDVRAFVTIDGPDASDDIRVNIRADGVPGGCMYIDDVSLSRTHDAGAN